MGVEEEPLGRANVSDEFAAGYIAAGGSPDVISRLAPQPSAQERDSTRVYYRGLGVTVTDRTFVAGGSTFRITDLYDLGMVQGPWPRTVTTSWAVAGLSALAAVVTVLLRSPQSLGVWLAAALTALVPSAAAVLTQRSLRRSWELWGRLEGRQVMLFRTSDQVTFGQVVRAVQRAVEANAP
jgi:Family of unknown function (DUF6232)